MSVWPPIVSVAVRALVLVVGATVKAAFPDPVPVPVLKVTQAASLVAVQAQVDPAVTVTEPVPPRGSRN